MEEFDFYVSNKKIKEDSFDCLNGSWSKSFSISVFLFLMFLVLTALTVLLSVFVNWLLSIPLALFELLILSILRLGYDYMALKLARQEEPAFGDLFIGFKKLKIMFPLLVKKFFLNIFWLLLLIVPFFVNAVGYSMANLLILDREDINSANALKESKHIMINNYGRYTKFLMSNFWWLLLIVATGGIAFLWVGQLVATRKALFYENLKTDF